MKIYTSKEVAKLLNISHWLVIQLLQRGEIKGFRTSKGKRSQWRITEEAVQEFIKNHTPRKC